MILRFLLPLGLVFATPYKELSEVLPFKMQSLIAQEDEVMLDLLIRKRNVRTIVEVGSWVGASTLFMAKRLPQGGKLYAIDTWLGCPEQQYRDYAKGMLPTLYEQFLSNVIHEKLDHVIHPMQMTSLEGAETLRGVVEPDLVFIDALHQEEPVYADLCAWYPFVEKQGIICGDDWNWKDENGKLSVRAAVRRFAKERGLKIKTLGTFWWLVNPSQLRANRSTLQ